MMITTDDFILNEKMRALYIQAPTSNTTVIVISSLFFFILWHHLAHDLLLIWTGLMWSAALLRLGIWYKQRRDKTRTASYWIRIYTLASAWVGLCWALIYLFLFSLENLVVTIALLMLLFGVISSAVTILSVHLPAFMAYVYPQLTALFVVLVYQHSWSFSLMAVGLMIYLVMLTLFARNGHELFRESLDLAARNRALVSDLNAEVERREAIIEERTAELREENRARRRTEQELLAQKESYFCTSCNLKSRISHVGT